MSTLNEVLERDNRVRADAFDDTTKAGWLIQLEKQLYEEMIMRHEQPIDSSIPDEIVSKYPEDGDKPLLVGAPYDYLYDRYLMAQLDFYNREIENYNNSALAFNEALDSWQKRYHQQHLPLGKGGLKNVW